MEAIETHDHLCHMARHLILMNECVHVFLFVPLYLCLMFLFYVFLLLYVIFFSCCMWCSSLMFVSDCWWCLMFSKHSCKLADPSMPGCTPVTGGLPLDDILEDIDSDREVEKIHSLLLSAIDLLDDLQGMWGHFNDHCLCVLPSIEHRIRLDSSAG